MRALVLILLCACVSIPKVASPQAENHVKQGAAALVDGDLDRAHAEYSLALRYAPHSAPAMNGLGLVAMARDDGPAARGWFAAALREDDDFAEAHANLGAVAMASGDLGLCVRESQAALAVDPGFATARHNLARALGELGRLTEAREEYMLLTSLSPRDAVAWGELAQIEFSLGHRQAATAASDRALLLDQHQPSALLVRAAILRNGESFLIYQAILERDPDHVDTLVVYATLLAQEQGGDEVLPMARHAVALAPRHPRARLALGTAYYVNRKYRLAAVELARAIALARERGLDLPQAELLRGECGRLLGDRAMMREGFERFLHLSKGDASLTVAREHARAALDEP
jgi:tetratricopeptide (TPR) repeat protein